MIEPARRQYRAYAGFVTTPQFFDDSPSQFVKVAPPGTGIIQRVNHIEADSGVAPIETRGLRISELGRRLDPERFEHERAGARRRAARVQVSVPLTRPPRVGA